MKTFGGNSGYVDYSMSKRALRARNEGALPKTDFKKEYGLTAQLFDMLDKLGIIYVSEWHHTSKFGNRTNFYRWTEDEYIGIYQEKGKEIRKLTRAVGKEPLMDDFADFRQWEQAFNAWQGHKREIMQSIQQLFDYED